MPNPRIASIRASRRTTAGLKVLFGQMGSTQHPRGHILRAYRNVRRGASSAFREVAPQVSLREVMQGFRIEMRFIIDRLLGDALSLGREQANAEIEAWELPPVQIPQSFDLMEKRDAWLGLVDAQIDATFASPTPEYILGGNTQRGVLQPAPVIQAGAHWLAATAVGRWLLGIQRPTQADRRGFEWWKQAIPAIDERTTDCCLQAAGQAVPLDDEFRLTGDPHYAEFQDWSPFHDWCRTSVALVPKHLSEDDLAQRLRNDAQKQILIRNNAKAEARDVTQQLVDLGTPGDSRVRKDDTKEIKKLRRRLLKLRPLTGYDLGDS